MKNLFNEKHRLGLGGVAIGTGFEVLSDKQSHDILQKAWDLGIRYYDTSPWYGLTKSEARFGEFLKDQDRSAYILSSKIGRLFDPVIPEAVPPTMWKAPFPFDFEHDYTADGTKRSIDDSLQRMGVDHLDIVFVHDLSEDQVGDRYAYYLKQAEDGAFKVLSDYRDQGIIKGWGLGVNKIEPILDCLEVADPDICLSATQYSILEHEDAVDRLIPAVQKRGVKLVSGAGYNSGFIAGRNRYNYKSFIPKGMVEKRERIAQIGASYGVGIIAIALQFVLANEAFVSIIPGASTTDQVVSNVEALNTVIPRQLWEELKNEGLIYSNAPVPQL